MRLTVKDYKSLSDVQWIIPTVGGQHVATHTDPIGLGTCLRMHTHAHMHPRMHPHTLSAECVAGHVGVMQQASAVPDDFDRCRTLPGAKLSGVNQAFLRFLPTVCVLRVWSRRLLLPFIYGSQSWLPVDKLNHMNVQPVVQV